MFTTSRRTTSAPWPRGGEVVNGPTDMPYRVREYAARDSEGGLWSFMQPADPADPDEGDER